MLNGADLAQIIDSSGKNSEDTIDDKISIKIGITLFKKYRKYAEKLTSNDILDALDTTDIALLNKSKKSHVCLKDKK